MSNRKIRQVSYQLPSTDIQLKVLFVDNSAWLTEDQIVTLFLSRSRYDKYEAKLSNETTTECIIKCLESVYKNNKYMRYKVTNFFTMSDYEFFLDIGKRKRYYNLDIVLAVGYCCNFKAAVYFRKWVGEDLHYTQVDPSFHKIYQYHLIQTALSFGLPFTAMTFILLMADQDVMIPIISLSSVLLLGVTINALNAMKYNEEKGYSKVFSNKNKK